MSKIKLVYFVCVSLLFFGTSVQANLRSSQNDFTTKFRKEKFIGGGSDQQAQCTDGSWSGAFSFKMQ